MRRIPLPDRFATDTDCDGYPIPHKIPETLHIAIPEALARPASLASVRSPSAHAVLIPPLRPLAAAHGNAAGGRRAATRGAAARRRGARGGAGPRAPEAGALGRGEPRPPPRPSSRTVRAPGLEMVARRRLGVARRAPPGPIRQRRSALPGRSQDAGGDWGPPRRRRPPIDRGRCSEALRRRRATARESGRRATTRPCARSVCVDVGTKAPRSKTRESLETRGLRGFKLAAVFLLAASIQLRFFAFFCFSAFLHLLGSRLRGTAIAPRAGGQGSGSAPAGSASAGACPVLFFRIPELDRNVRVRSREFDLRRRDAEFGPPPRVQSGWGKPYQDRPRGLARLQGPRPLVDSAEDTSPRRRTADPAPGSAHQLPV